MTYKFIVDDLRKIQFCLMRGVQRSSWSTRAVASEPKHFYFFVADVSAHHWRHHHHSHSPALQSIQGKAGSQG